MPRKLRVGIVFGGRSGEHEVSLRSAASVLAAIDKKKYDVVPIGIAKTGHWLLADDAQHMLAGGTTVTATTVAKNRSAHPSALVPAAHPAGHLHVPAPAAKEQAQALGVDVLFPVLHGTFGEDGTIQGLFELAGKAYVGSGVLGSAAGMDKDVMKRLFAAAGLPIVEHITLFRGVWQRAPRKAIAEIEASLRYPLFVKPANLGSSVGIAKVWSEAELGPALDAAFAHDSLVIVEGFSSGMEVECSVLGNGDPEASIPGEIVLTGSEWYDYEAKYQPGGMELVAPARLPDHVLDEVRRLACDTFVRVGATVELTAPGRDSLITRLVEDPAKNVERWKALPYLMNFQDVGQPKPGAVVLVAAVQPVPGYLEHDPGAALDRRVAQPVHFPAGCVACSGAPAA